MHCFLCMTYLMIIATAHPPTIRENIKNHVKRSIFNDVIQSLRMRSQIPEDIDINDENNINQNYDKYSQESMDLPSDVDFMPRRNDRIEMPPMKYRFPKNLILNNTDSTEKPKDEIVLYVNTPVEYKFKPTPQPKKPKPTKSATKTDTNKENNNYGLKNTMGGQSHIGHRESQTVVKPTVIVNFRGTVRHTESDVHLERKQEDNETVNPQNVFNINQEINLEGLSDLSSLGKFKRTPSKMRNNMNNAREVTQLDEDMMMCETSSSKEKDQPNRKYKVLQILLTV